MPSDVFYLKNLKVGNDLPCNHYRHKRYDMNPTVRGFHWDALNRYYKGVCSCNRSFTGTLTGGFKWEEDYVRRTTT